MRSFGLYLYIHFYILIKALLQLSIHSSVALCNTPSESSPSPTPIITGQNLRIELYSDILHACALSPSPSSSLSSFHFATDTTLEQYYARLKYRPSALNPPHDPSASDLSSFDPSLGLYDKAILTIWELFRRIKLCCIHIEDGVFGHLGTSSEFLDLICSFSSSTSSGNGSSSNTKHSNTSNTSAVATDRNVLDISSNHDKNKRDIFSMKCNLQSSINSRCIHYDVDRFDPFSSSSIRGVIVNSLIYIDVTLTDRAIDAIPSIGSCTLIEHSILFGSCSIGSHSIVSHIYSPRLSRDLVVNDNMMLQQVPLLPLSGAEAGAVVAGAVYEARYVVVLLGLHDDVKASYSKGKGSVCGVLWPDFFQVWSSSVHYMY